MLCFFQEPFSIPALDRGRKWRVSDREAKFANDTYALELMWLFFIGELVIPAPREAPSLTA
jgi:hypothetical protein